MAATFGISLLPAGGTIIETIDVDSKVDVKVLIDTEGAYSEGRAIGAQFSFSVKGKGVPSVTLGGSSGAPSNVSGKIIITSVKLSRSNEDWEAYEYAGSAYPSAS
jgi:hypothetical protein